MNKLEKYYVQKMKDLPRDDKEMVHINADTLLREFLLKAGFKDLHEAYADACEDVWYA